MKAFQVDDFRADVSRHSHGVAKPRADEGYLHRRQRRSIECRQCGVKLLWVRVDANENESLGSGMVNPRFEAEVCADHDKRAAFRESAVKGANRDTSEMRDERTRAVAPQCSADAGFP
ncbi:MAG: hypothetical protein QG616_2283 [Pseudomonadota bacterium]|nr:hypothetical protein [Pseudomonadota bacterium]MDQ5902927.1 hypothetical protein [Pseudomonadota bacterium]MDQ5914376.1 hypothetical protein [Pseudomonadota bacterium]MDQ5942773.1 hypothetical protein [Pseudomonadota bacterium]MDQ5946429.1 hypothetical protein [Pseudomonadota bacterium]